MKLFLQVNRRCQLTKFTLDIQWNLDYTSKSGLKNLDVELRETYK